MTAVIPPPSPPPSTAPPPAASRFQVVAEPSGDAARLPLGAQVQGQILPGAPKGLVHIGTAAGVVVGKSSVPLPVGADVTLLLQARSPQLQLQIAAVNGQAPQSFPAAQAVTRSGAGEAVTISLRSSDASSKTAGAPPSLQPGASRGLPTLTPGATATATLLQPAQWAADGGGASPSSASLANSGAPSATNPSTALSAGTGLSVRIVSVQPPSTGREGVAVAGPGSPTLAGGQVLRGNVIDATPGAQILLRTPAGIMNLDAMTNASRGTVVTLELIGPQPALSPTSGFAGASSVPQWTPATSDWPALKAAMDTLQAVNPQIAQQVIDTALPHADARLTTQTLFFLWALGRGNVGDWLGQGAMQALKDARPELLSQLKEEFRRMGQTLDKPESVDWRVVNVPLSSGAAIEPVRLLMRRNGGEANDGGKKDQTTRFVVEVNLTRLGRMQFDGLVRDDGKRLDLMVRSEAPLAPDIRDTILDLFRHSSELVGLKGDLGFQAAPPEFVEIAPDTAAGAHTGVTV